MSWLLLLFMSNGHSRVEVTQVGPFATAAECQRIAAVIAERTWYSRDDRLCIQVKTAIGEGGGK